MSVLEETKQMKVVQLHNESSKQFLNPNLPKNSPLGPQKVKNDPKIKSKLNIRIEGNIENESCLTASVEPKIVFEPYPNPKYSPIGQKKVKNDPKIKSKYKVKIEKKEV